MKLNLKGQLCAKVGRPFTGAWIETGLVASMAKDMARRPFTGAWIETEHTPIIMVMQRLVAPSRGRGLKPGQPDNAGPAPQGRPFTGAWIETFVMPWCCLLVPVAPSRGRGLKRAGPWDGAHSEIVAPSRGRGLKQPRHTPTPSGRASPLHGGVD